MKIQHCIDEFPVTSSISSGGVHGANTAGAFSAYVEAMEGRQQLGFAEALEGEQRLCSGPKVKP